MPLPQTPAQHNKYKIYLGSTLLYLGTWVSTIVFSPLIISCIFFPFSIRYKLGKCWAGSVLKMAELFCGVTYEVKGIENTKINTAAIVLSNHQSAWETIAFRYILPPQTSLFKQSLLLIPFWGWAMATLKPISIDRNSKHSALRKLISRGTAALQEGLWVIVFPEGTRMPLNEMGSFSAGGAMLAQKSGYPVIPIAHDAGKCWGRNSFLKYPGVIKVTIGSPIVSAARKANEINQDAEDWVVNARRELDQ